MYMLTVFPLNILATSVDTEECIPSRCSILLEPN